ncbi:Na+/H+ antiporter subunit E [Zunongwangia sp.]|uniref:Na+/H+ antiporter subunit E n=1 Tax=Zunongwangia sp. TaxID=1965325 RepID=UPI003AA8663D
MKNSFVSNILLTFVWVVLTGDFHFTNYLFGFILSYFILMVITSGARKAKYFTIVPKLINFVFFFVYELIKANLQVAWEVGTPKLHMRPGIIKVPLTVQSDAGITLLANMITLTPGTLSLDVSDDKKVLYVHAMYIDDKEEFVAGIKNGFEKRILDILT